MMLGIEITIYLPYAQSLKDKRSAAKSVLDRARRLFNASVAEIDTQDAIKTLTLGAAVISSDGAHARKSLDEVLRFIEANIQGEIACVTDL